MWTATEQIGMQMNAKQHAEEYSAFWPSAPVLRPAELGLPVAWPYSVTL